MKARFLLSFCFCCAALFSACSMYYNVSRVDSKFFSGDQKKLLDKINAVSGYGTGFDEEINLDYFFINNQRTVNSKNADKEVLDILKSAGEKGNVDLFERILYLHELTLYVMERHKEIEDWRGYTYIEKYLLPPLESYEALLQRNIYGLYSYRNTESKRKEFAAKISAELKGYWDVDLWQTVH